MGKRPRTRSGQFSGTGKGSVAGREQPPSKLSKLSSTSSSSPLSLKSPPAGKPVSKPLSPAPSTPDVDSGSRRHTHEDLGSSGEDVASEIVVRTDDMDVEESGASGSLSPPQKQEAQEESPDKPDTPQPDPLEQTDVVTLAEEPEEMQDPQPSIPSSQSAPSEQSDLSSVPSSPSSKATTPIDIDSSKETADKVVSPPVMFQQGLKTERPRRKYNVRPRVSIPTDRPLKDYAEQCIAAADASRLNPLALHQEEYEMLRDHIGHPQVTTYLNIRNGILRLWIRNVQIAVTREEAIGCAKDSRWFEVANLCFDWLVRRGYINFGCVEIRAARKRSHAEASHPLKRRRVVVIGAGFSGLGCARQLEGLFTQYRGKLREQGEEPPEVVVLEGRNRVGGRVYSRTLDTPLAQSYPGYPGQRCTAEMGGMIITGFERGNPMNVLVRGQLALPYHNLRPDTTIYDSNGKPVDEKRDAMVETLFNDCLDRVSAYKFRNPTSKLIEGNSDLMNEGRDSSAEVNKTIRHVEEALAAQPHAPPVSEQSIAPQVDLVHVSTDKATGRIHTEPGKPGAQKAAQKAKEQGWVLKHGVTEEDDLDLESASKEPGATLGSVTEHAFSQYRKFLDLNAQDFRLFNWHVANLEYSNATNYHNMSLPGWDIDVGNEWEGKHTMITGGYQSVPRGLLCHPTKLNIRHKAVVKKITYTESDLTGPAIVECEDGTKVEADVVVNTIPLGVLKHGGIEFEPPLPSWKLDAINRLGFGVLNKVVLVYKQPFWDESRDIFGVLRDPPVRHSLDQKDYAERRGRFFQWFNVSKPSGLPVLIALMAGDAGFDVEKSCNDDLVDEATEVLRSVYGKAVPRPVEAIVTRWASDKFARGSYSSAGPGMKADDYDTMAHSIGNLYFAGEHTIGTHPATVHGAYLSGLRAASEVLDAILGPITIMSPLIEPKETPASLKRKAPESKDPAQARKEAYEAEMWEYISAKIGPRPVQPPKPCMNAYIFFSKANYEAARQRCEALRRRPGKGRSSANEVRGMSSKMWKDTPPEERQPFEALAEQKKKEYAAAIAQSNEEAKVWDGKYLELKAAYEKEHPNAPSAEELEMEKLLGQGRRSRQRVSYADVERSDDEMDE